MEHTFAGLPLPLRIKPPYTLTDDEIIRFSDEHKPCPVERDPEGYLLIMTPSGTATGRKNNYLSAMLYNWAEEDGRGLSFDSNTGFTLPDGSMRAPDAAWLSQIKWNALTREQQERYAPVCPDFVVELRSPSDVLADLQAKMGMWMRNGAVLAWLLDPVERTVTVYRQHQSPEVLENISQVSGEGPVAGFILPLDRIFA